MTGDVILVLTLLILAFQWMVQLTVFINASHRLPIEAEQFTDPVSMIVCVRDEELTIGSLIDAILKQDHSNFELLIVDDHSLDGTPSILEQYAKRDERVCITTLKPEPRGGKKYALDLAIRKAKHDLILLTDGDCLIDDQQWIQQYLSAFHKTKADLVIGSGHYKMSDSWIARMHALEAFRSHILFHTAAQLDAPYMAIGRSMALRKESYVSIGGFGKELETPGTDDLLLHRFMDKYKVVSLPEAITWSNAPQSLNDWLAQKKRHLSVGKRYPTWSLVWIWANDVTLLLLPILLIYGLFRVDIMGWLLTLMVLFRMILFRYNLLIFKQAGSIQDRHVDLWWAEFLMSYWNALISVLTVFVHTKEWTKRKQVQGQSEITS